METMRVFFKGKDPTKAELKKLFTHKERNGLHLPQTLINELDNYCQGCGTPFAKAKGQAEYFGQMFCIECVDKWSSGEK